MLIKSQQHVQLGLFVGVSLLLHALFLLQYRDTDISLAARTEQLAGEMLRVSLQREPTHAQQTPPAHATPAHDPAPKQTRDTEATAAPVAHEQTTAPTVLPDAHIVRNTENDTTPVNSREARAEVLSRVRENFAQHFYYPMLARRHGWQGQVLLGFSVAANGRIHDVHVQRGSGYSVLDESAQSALNRIKQLQQIRHWLSGDSMQLQLSVVYRLQGG